MTQPSPVRPVLFAILAVGGIAAAFLVGRHKASVAVDPAVPVDTPRASVAPAARASAASVELSGPAQTDLDRAKGQSQVAASNARLAARYSTEPLNGAWAEATSRNLVAAARSPQMAELKADVRDLQVDCRSTVCRVSGQFATRTAAEDWVMLYLTSVGGSLPGSTYSIGRNADGSARIEMYGASRL